MRRRWPLAGAGVLGVTGAALAVTAWAVTRGDDYDAVAAAGARTVEAGTARVTMTTVADGGPGQGPQRVDADGTLEFATGASRLEMRVGEPGATDTSSTGSVVALVVSDGTDTALRLATWPDERPWARVPDDALGAGVDTANVVSLLPALGRGAEEVERLDTEQIRGAETQQHRVAVDLARAAETAPEPQRTALQALAAQAGDELALDVWVGEERVHRVSYTLPVADTSGDPAAEPAPTSSEGSLTVVVEYHDVGVPFTGEMPADVVDVDGTT